MSATDELRRMLDERGMEWVDTGDGSTLIPEQAATNVAWDVNVWPSGKDMGDCLWVQNRHPLTPEQAIFATLGGTCETCPQVDNPDSFIRHLMGREPIVRCCDCAFAYRVHWPESCDVPPEFLNCQGPLVALWDYERDEPKDNPVEPDGFCAWGERRKK